MAQRTSSHVLGATLLGGVAGATLALLFAPRSGKETRERIKHTASDLKADATAKLSKAKSKVQQGVESAREMKDRIKETGKEVKNDSKRGERPLSAWEEEI